MRIKIKNRVISNCYKCRDHAIDGGPTPVMYCNKGNSGYIINHDEIKDNGGFPYGCPLLKDPESEFLEDKPNEYFTKDGDFIVKKEKDHMIILVDKEGSTKLVDGGSKTVKEKIFKRVDLQ